MILLQQDDNLASILNLVEIYINLIQRFIIVKFETLRLANSSPHEYKPQIV